MRKTLIGFVTLVWFVTALTGPASAEAPYTDYVKAPKQCRKALKKLSSEALVLRTELKTQEDARRTIHNAFVGQEPRTLTKSKAKQWTTEFKNPNLEFNRTIKEYQNKCKRVEAIIKGRLILGE